MKDIQPILSSFGFTDSESTVYLLLLEKGSASAGELATQANLSRQTTYLALQHLQERGLVTNSTTDATTLFAAEPPQQLLAYAQRHESEIRDRIENLSRMLPELELLAGREKPTVKMFEGRESIIAALIELKKADAPVLYEISDIETLESLFSENDLRPLRTETEQSIPAHGIYQLPVSRKLTNPNARLLPTEIRGFNGSVSVFGDTVVLASFEDKMHSVIIQSSAIAETLRILFQHQLGTLPIDEKS